MKRSSEIIPNDNVLRYYFYFMQERMNIFWRKCEGKEVLTQDPILREYKFTNVYRACDRVSQYLIRDVIYKDIELYTPEDVILRVLVFKIFNKIETWEYLCKEYGDITMNHFDVDRISYLLSLRRNNFPVFNNAYMMTGSDKKYEYLKFKHEKWLTMVKKEFIDEGVINKVLKAKTLEEVFNLLECCTFIGGFLAYQYAIDFNYTPYVNFSENSFVKAGIGAIRGIKKCFISYGRNYEDAIFYIQQHLDKLRKRYGYDNFKPLPGHEPTLIDLQNCFCETDKFLRVKMPELQIDNVKIKQHYKPASREIKYQFPYKWGINDKINGLCLLKNTKELTLF